MTDSALLSLFTQAAELAAILVKSPEASSALTSRLLHARKRLTRDDRRAIAHLAYGTLRLWGAVDPEIHAPQLMARALRHLGPRAVARAIQAGLHVEVWDARSDLPGSLPEFSDPEVWYSALARISGEVEPFLPDPTVPMLPSPLVEDLRGSSTHPWTDSECRDLGLALARPPRLWLRVRHREGAMERVRSELTERGILVHPHPLLPRCIALAERTDLSTLPAWREGDCEIQDAGSQVIAPVLGVRPGMTVLDACAGGGGKTLHLAELLGGSGTVVARDASDARLVGLEKRAARVDTRRIRVEKQATRNRDRFDAILLDAPCSGLGTARRHPTLLWRTTQRTLEKLHALQSRILDEAVTQLLPGGTILYATCSFHPRENEEVVRAFLDRHSDFHLSPIHPHRAAEGLLLPGLDPMAGMYFLHPALWDGDGYFFARLKQG